MTSIVVMPLRVYQRLISPVLPPSCKYHPSCSQYAIDAVTTYGVCRGLVLAAWRVLRCNPLSNGGFDPIAHQRLFHRARPVDPAARSEEAAVS